MTTKVAEFDVSYEADLGEIIKRLCEILPEVEQFTVTPIGPGGGNPCIVVAKASGEQRARLAKYLDEELQLEEWCGPR